MLVIFCGVFSRNQQNEAELRSTPASTAGDENARPKTIMATHLPQGEVLESIIL
jgi:hypothetical protein